MLKSAVQKCGKKWVPVAALVPGRSHHQCRKRWYHCMDPSSPSCGRWTAAEDARLKAAVKKHGDKNWSAIAPLVGGRHNEQCRRRWFDVVNQSTFRVTGTWTAAEDAKLTALVETHGDTDWVKVAALVPGRSYLQCRQRWVRYLTPTNLTKGHFTSREDAKLEAAVFKHGIKNWIAVAEMVPNRTFLQCRNRWVRVLGVEDPAKGYWTAAEDAKLKAAIRIHGDDDNWWAVAKYIPGRTYLQCRQRWVGYLTPTGRPKGKKTLKAKSGYSAERRRLSEMSLVDE
jgi:hypothetical protein